MRKNLNKLFAAGIAASVLAGTATTSFALPVASNNQAVSQAAPATTTDIRWRHRGRWIGLGVLGLGVAAATAPYYYNGYYGPRYYGGYDPYYGGGCWRDRWGRVFCR
jgi:hypothetical protein